MQDVAEKAFRSKKVNDLYSRPRHELDRPYDHVFVSIDPNGGGESRWAVVSAVYARGAMIIVGLEAIRTHKPSDYESVLLDHLRRLRATKWLTQCVFVLMPEANLGFEAHHIERVVNQTEMRKFSMCMRDDEQPGLRTTHAVKESMHVKFNQALEEDAVSVSTTVVSAGGDAEKLLKDLRDELTTYCCVVDNGTSVFAQSKKTFTGKIGGFQDDLAICAQLNLLWHSSFFTDQKYATYR